jgi:hypothetical protein
MTRTTKTALGLCVVLLGTAIEARADCHQLRGSIAETRIPSDDQFGRLLGTVTGVLNGASTVFITSLSPVTSYDVFLTTAGDVLIAEGRPVRTPVPGEPGEFITHVELTIVGGSGKYAQATGTMTFDGQSHGTVPPTADLIYSGRSAVQMSRENRTDPRVARSSGLWAAAVMQLAPGLQPAQLAPATATWPLPVQSAGRPSSEVRASGSCRRD